jgi:hypothetical protein
MRKKRPSPQPWTIQLESVYRRERDERLARAYELVLPILTKNIPTKPEEEKENDTVTTPHRPLRTRLQ